MSEIDSDDEELFTPGPKTAPSPPRRTVQATLDLFVTEVQPTILSQHLDTTSPLQPGQKTSWTERAVRKEKKRLALTPPKPEPQPRTESTVAGIVSMLPRAVVDEMIVSIIEKQQVVTKDRLREVLVDVRSTNLGKLPDEILVNIFSYLPLHDKLKCILRLCTRFRPIIAEKALWKTVSLLKKDTHLEGKGATPVWIKGPGAVRLVTKVIPENTIRSLSVHAETFSRTQILKCLTTHKTIKELNLVGSNFASPGRFRDFNLEMESLDTFRIVTSHHGKGTLYPSWCLSDWLIKVRNLKHVAMDFQVSPFSEDPIFHDPMYEFPLLRNLVRLDLGRVQFSTLFRVLQSCTSLKHLSLQEIYYNQELTSWTPRFNQYGELSYWIPGLVPESLAELTENMELADGVARLESLEINLAGTQVNGKKPVAQLVTISHAVGRSLKRLVIKSGAIPLRGTFPVLETLSLCDPRWTPAEPSNAAREIFGGFEAPNLARVERRGWEFEKKTRETSGLRDGQFWFEVKRMLRSKVKVVEMKADVEMWKNPFEELW